MVKKLILASALFWIASFAYARATTFYVDAMHGADTSNGISRHTAWKTLSRVNRAHLAPGDQVHFHTVQTRWDVSGFRTHRAPGTRATRHHS